MMSSPQSSKLGVARLVAKALLEARAGTEVAEQRLLPGRGHEDDPLDAALGALAHHEVDHRRVDEREQLLRHRPAEWQEARPQAAGDDNGRPYLHHRGLRPRPLTAAITAASGRVRSRLPTPRPPAASAHGCDHRFSADTVNGTSSVVRGAKPVTARSGGLRSVEPSTSSSSVPSSTTCRSTVGVAPKRMTCTTKRWRTMFVERTNPFAFQSLSASASSL